MSDSHYLFIGLAYSLTALGIVAECVALWLRRRQAIAQVLRDADLDESPSTPL